LNFGGKMEKGMSIHIGVNELSDHYGGLESLKSCNKDAEDMAKIAVSAGFEILTVLKNQNATVLNVTTAITDSIKKLNDDDTLLITYSGHGTQKRETSPFDELDLKDETWCLFDRQIMDDELKIQWLKVEKKVRILVISDSCHSGTLVESNSTPLGMSKKTRKVSELKELLPQSVEDIFEVHKDIYKDAKKIANKELEKIKDARGSQNLLIADLLLISACQEFGVTRDGLDNNDNGAFTKSLKKIWTELTSLGINNYEDFSKAITESLKTSPNYQRVPNQISNCYAVGNNGEFLKNQRPFKI
jgi:metacaspase-1